MRRFRVSLLVVAAWAVAFGAIAGCENDVKRTEVKQTTQVSDPEPVPPGDMIIVE